MHISGCQALGEGENGEQLPKEFVVSFWGAGNVLEPDRGGGCSVL